MSTFEIKKLRVECYGLFGPLPLFVKGIDRESLRIAYSPRHRPGDWLHIEFVCQGAVIHEVYSVVVSSSRKDRSTLLLFKTASDDFRRWLEEAAARRLLVLDTGRDRRKLFTNPFSTAVHPAIRR